MSHIHIPDGVLPTWLWLAGWILTLALVGIAGRVASRVEMRRKVPLLGVVSALMLVAMSSEIIPIAYHVNLTVVAGVLLGPVLAVIAAFVVEVVLSMLGHGGVTVLGLNTLIVAAEMVVGWALFRAGVRALGRNRVRPSALVATVLTLALTTTALVGIVWIGGESATSRETGALDPADLRFENPFSAGVFDIGLFSGGHDEADHAEEDPSRDIHGEDEHDHGAEAEDEHDHGPALSVRRFAAVVYTLGPIGWVLEGLVTALILGYVARVRPTLIFSGALAETHRRIPGDEAGGI